MFEKEYKKTDLIQFCKLAGITCYSNRTKSEIADEIREYLDEYKYAPRYLRGLSKDEKYLRKFEIRYGLLREKAGKISKSEIYSPTKVDTLYKEKNQQKYSKYTLDWNKKYPDCKSLTCKSKVSGVPLDVLKRVADKGAAAWRSGAHRPGANQGNWEVSRVNSFLLCGKTWAFPDHKLALEALERDSKVKKFWKKCDKSRLGKRTPSR